MKKLDGVVRSSNPYAQAYKNFAETERQIGNAEELQLIFSKDPSKDKTYDVPQCSEVAIVFNGAGGNAPEQIDFAVFKKDGGLVTMSHTSPNADPMVYPLLFPNGERGWHPFLRTILSEIQQFAIDSQCCSSTSSGSWIGEISQPFTMEGNCFSNLLLYHT